MTGGISKDHRVVHGVSVAVEGCRAAVVTEDSVPLDKAAHARRVVARVQVQHRALGVEGRARVAKRLGGVAVVADRVPEVAVGVVARRVDELQAAVDRIPGSGVEVEP
jgi:hypothetical protein